MIIVVEAGRVEVDMRVEVDKVVVVRLEEEEEVVPGLVQAESVEMKPVLHPAEASGSGLGERWRKKGKKTHSNCRPPCYSTDSHSPVPPERSRK